MRRAGNIPFLARIPPPLLFMAAFLIGWAIQGYVPVSIYSQDILVATEVMGMVFLLGGTLLSFSCLIMFLAARTTLIPFGIASSLITGGPYRLSRNPMYTSLILIYIGAASMLVLPWTLPLLALPLLALNAVIIPFEEARLLAIFGNQFTTYSRQVRRWI